MRARWLVLLVLIALVPAPRAVGADCVQVGVLGEFKRPTAQTGEIFGTVMRRGVDLGVKALAATPESGCFKVHDIDFDNSVANIGDVIRSAVRQWGIRYFIGLGTSDQVHAALPALKETGALLFTPTATDDDLNDRANRIVMMFPRNSQMAGAMAAAAAKQGIKEVVTVYAENSRFSANMAAEFRESLKRSGGKVVREIAVRTGKVDLEPLLGELRKQPFTHVFAPLYELDAAQTVSFFVKHGLTHRFIGADSWGSYGDVLKLMTAGATFSALMPLVYDDTLAEKANVRFVEDYKRAHGEKPTDFAGFSYDAVRLLSRARGKCADAALLKDPYKCLEQALPFPSLTGPVRRLDGTNLERAVRTRIMESGGHAGK